MNRYLLAVAVCFIISCGQSNPSAPAPVTPGTVTALYTSPKGDATMITQADSARTTFEANSTITTPPGAEFSITLADKSRVFLNAASSIKIIQYDKTSRILSLTGEAYFEVSTNPQAPFTVKTEDGSITAFGTSFNILAYPDEPKRSATLVNGALQVECPSGTVSLKPGQQVTINKSLLVSNADLEKTLAWKEGFYDASEIGGFIRQLSRWHGLTPVFSSPVPEISFEGKIPRAINLKDIVTILHANKIKVVVDEKQKSLSF